MKDETRVTLEEMNKRPGQIMREVHFTKKSKTVTANGKPIVQLSPIALSENNNGDKKKGA